MPKNKTDSLSDNDIERIGNLLDGRLAPLEKKYDDMNEYMRKELATKTELKQEISVSEERLKDYIHQGIDAVMQGMDRISEQMAEKDRVESLEKVVYKSPKV